MSQDKPNLHMSFQLSQGDILPPLQKRIVRFLAENNPQTILGTAKALNSGYKSLWTAFNSLKEKKVIQAVSVKSYRNQEYDCFWVTSTGILIALFDGANPQTLLEKSIEIYPNDMNLQCILEVSPILGTEAFKFAFGVLLEKGKLEKEDISVIIATQMQQEVDISQMEPLLAILKRHPLQHEKTKEYAKELGKKIDKLQSMLK
jgi:hypothetical protein